jgi:hypothetical protein
MWISARTILSAATLLLVATPVSGQALRGRLLEWPCDRPIAGGTVSLYDTAGARITSTVSRIDGTFIMTAPTQRLLVLHGSANGYYDMMADDTLEFVGADTLEIEFRLRIMPVALDAVEAEVSGEGVANPRLADTGFFQRRRLGQGEFLTRTEIDERPSTQRITDLLLGMRGVMVTRDGIVFRAPGSSIMGSCTPRVYLDGMLSGLELALDFNGINSVPVDAIEAIEVYRGPAEIPPQYGGAQGTCGVLLLWMRRGDTQAREPSDRGHLVGREGPRPVELQRDVAGRQHGGYLVTIPPVEESHDIGSPTPA